MVVMVMVMVVEIVALAGMVELVLGLVLAVEMEMEVWSKWQKLEEPIQKLTASRESSLTFAIFGVFVDDEGRKGVSGKSCVIGWACIGSSASKTESHSFIASMSNPRADAREAMGATSDSNLGSTFKKRFPPPVLAVASNDMPKRNSLSVEKPGSAMVRPSRVLFGVLIGGESL
jgi:hypothetical protein